MATSSQASSSNNNSNNNIGRRRHPFLDVRVRLRKISGMSIVDETDAHSPSGSIEAASTEKTLATENKTSDPGPRPSIITSSASFTAQASSQPQSPLFKLPLEIRRIIYVEIWRAHLGPDAHIHIYAAPRAAGLMHAPCVCGGDVSGSASDNDDPINSNPWPAWRGAKQPPEWFWHAWSLRLRWGRHWRCQENVMLQWGSGGDDANGGTCSDNRPGRGGEKTPFMNVFLTCKSMYAEAIESLFETATFVFTASEDAYRFLVQQPHPHMSSIRRLDFCLSHHKDHLFLFRIDSKHPQLSCCQTVPIGWELWDPLMTCVKGKLPELQTLNIHLAHQPHGREDKFLRLLDAWETAGVLTIERKGHGVRRVAIKR